MSGWIKCNSCNNYLCICIKGSIDIESLPPTFGVIESTPNMDDVTRLLKDQDLLREEIKALKGKHALVTKLCTTVSKEVAPLIATKNDSYWVKLIETIAEILKDEK